MLGGIALLLTCQVAGEVIVGVSGLPVPGPVAGMAVLLAVLIVRGGVPRGLDATAGGLLSHLSLLFVPAGVGIMLYADLIAAEWVPIAAAVVGGTLIAVVVTGVAMKALVRRP